LKHPNWVQTCNWLAAEGIKPLFSLQSAMLIALGWFLAGLVAFLLAPLYRMRAERLATDALRASMPMTEAEIRADKDRLRAEHAIAVHQLEAKAEQQDLSAGRQMVEINRRDALISALEGQLSETRTKLDEHENARRVLEQTITDRLPRVEARLLQAKTQLDERDQLIVSLTETQNNYVAALQEAHQINRQQLEELSRMSSSVATRSNRNRDEGGDQAQDSDVALRSELDALRAKSRDQSSLIERLQSAPKRAAGPMFGHLGPAINDSPEIAELEINRLKQSLADAEAAMKAAAGEPDQITPALEKKIELQATLIESHETEISRLKSEVASAHERLAQQTAKHKEELARALLQSNAEALPFDLQQKKPTLIDRISQPRVEMSDARVPLQPDTSKAAEDGASGVTAEPRVHRGGLIERLSEAQSAAHPSSTQSKPAAPGE
jgi:hypothetical protein